MDLHMPKPNNYEEKNVYFSLKVSEREPKRWLGD